MHAVAAAAWRALSAQFLLHHTRRLTTYNDDDDVRVLCIRQATTRAMHGW